MNILEYNGIRILCSDKDLQANINWLHRSFINHFIVYKIGYTTTKSKALHQPNELKIDTKKI